MATAGISKDTGRGDFVLMCQYPKLLLICPVRLQQTTNQPGHFQVAVLLTQHDRASEIAQHRRRWGREVGMDRWQQLCGLCARSGGILALQAYCFLLINSKSCWEDFQQVLSVHL